MAKKVFEGVIGTKEVKISVEVQESRTIHLERDETITIDLPHEIYRDCPQLMSILLRTVPEYYPILLTCGKAYILTSEGLKEVGKGNPFMKKE